MANIEAPERHSDLTPDSSVVKTALEGVRQDRADRRIIFGETFIDLTKPRVHAEITLVHRRRPRP